jgi:hypothetical protein
VKSGFVKLETPEGWPVYSCARTISFFCFSAARGLGNSIAFFSPKRRIIHQLLSQAIVVLLFFRLAAALFAGELADEEGRSRFRAVDIYLDSKGTPLAAYQLEFAVTNIAAKIVGIEGGAHPAFHEAPFYDTKAIQHERVIIAAFSTDSPEKLPIAKTRIATIHLQIIGGGEPAFFFKLQAAADSQGTRISAEPTVQLAESK